MSPSERDPFDDSIYEKTERRSELFAGSPRGAWVDLKTPAKDLDSPAFLRCANRTDSLSKVPEWALPIFDAVIETASKRLETAKKALARIKQLARGSEEDYDDLLSIARATVAHKIIEYRTTIMGIQLAALNLVRDISENGPDQDMGDLRRRLIALLQAIQIPPIQA